MGTKTNTFLLNRTICIPRIQRDYVQGADANSGKRDKFVSDLLNSLKDGKHLEIDFIYGTPNRNGDYLPFDGQQRLTTLILLGWLLRQYCLNQENLTEEKKAEYEQWSNYLVLTYETRDSSREFCDNLLKWNLPETNSAPSKLIKQQIWYAEDWNQDPTIKAMLEMLDHIKTELDNNYSADIPAMAHNFFNDSPIEFEETTLGRNTNGNADDMYIKINARGKHLTEFENWKAHFIDFLRSKHHEESFNGQQFDEYFEDKIEKDWCDFFWDYCDKSQETPVIDVYFMRFYNYVTSILYASAGHSDPLFRDIKEKEENKRLEQADIIYSDKRNVETLFKALDILPSLDKSFFDKHLFKSVDPKDSAIRTETRVNIFNEIDNVNLRDAVIKGENAPHLRHSLLLWGIIRHECEYPTTNTLEFIRLWWGYLMHLRQRLAKGFEVRQDISLEDIGKKSILTDLDTLLSDPDPFRSNTISGSNVKYWSEYNSATKKNLLPRDRFEKDIAPLQNHPWLIFDLHSLNNLIVDPNIPAGEVFDKFQQNFANASNCDRIKMLIDCGFEGIDGKEKKGKYTYGLTGNWPYILTTEDPQFDKVMENYLRKTNPGISQNHRWLNEFVRSYTVELSKKRFAAFDIEKDYVMYSVPDGKSLDRRGYRAEPFSYVVIKRVFPGIATNGLNQPTTNKNVGSGKDVTITFYNENKNHYGICIRYADAEEGVQMECVETGWMIKRYNPLDDQPFPIPDSVLNKYDEGKIVEDEEELDRVQTGEELLKDLLSLL